MISPAHFVYIVRIVEPMHSLPDLFLIPAQHTSQDIHIGPSVKESIFPPSSFHLWGNIHKNNPKNGFKNPFWHFQRGTSLVVTVPSSCLRVEPFVNVPRLNSSIHCAYIS